MALITDLDDLDQGTSTAVSDADFGAPSGEVVTVTSAANLPAMSANDFVEVRDHSTVAFNGLYQETGGSPTTSSITITKISGSSIAAAGDPASEAVTMLGATGGLKNVMFDTEGLTVYLLEKGLLSTDGVTMLALHSFMKERWKDDAFLIAAAAFPMVGISFAAGQWQIGVDPSGNNNGWTWATNISSPSVVETRRLIRNAGWEEITSAGITQEKHFNVTTLGTFEDVADLAYYRFGTDATDLAADVDFEFADVVNEPVKFYENFGNADTLDFATSSTITRASGSFITDGYQVGGQVTVQNADVGGNNGSFVVTAVVALTLTVTGTPFTTGADTNARLAVDNSNAFQPFLRIRDADPEGKTFDQSDLTGAGETEIIAKIIKFPLANVTDLDITATDASITGGGPWDQIVIRYFDQAFNREVDSATNRDFGIVVDVGTHSGVDGSAPGAASVWTTAEGGLEDFGAGTYNGGTLRVHEGTDENITYTISSHTDTTITVSDGPISSHTNASFTAQRSTPVSATKNQIYEKVQWSLRQSSDIDATTNVINGRTADAMMVFEGTNLRVGKLLPANPNGGGSGVIIEGFDANDTNNLFFFDNTGVQRNFPFVAAGTLNFNQGLVDDTDGEFWLFYEYTTRTTNSDIDTVGPSGDTYDLEGTLPNMAVNDYIQISGFVQAENNGLFIVTVENTPSVDYTVRKVDGSNVGTAETNQTVNVDENPYPSPDAIIVDDNSVVDISGAIGSTSIAFDFDYDNNVQGGRTQGTDANVVLVAGGLENAQMAVASGLLITAATGLSFSLTSAQERNYDNP